MRWAAADGGFRWGDGEGEGGVAGVGRLDSKIAVWWDVRPGVVRIRPGGRLGLGEKAGRILWRKLSKGGLRRRGGLRRGRGRRGLDLFLYLIWGLLLFFCIFLLIVIVVHMDLVNRLIDHHIVANMVF